MNVITDRLIYLIYPILATLLLFEAKISRKNEWNKEAFSLSQMKAIQGFAAICIMLHHAGQKTCASWINKIYVRHGLDVFVPIGYWLVGIFLFCSGYGLYVSYKKKENYFKGYFKRRVLPLILAFYSTGWIFLLVRFLMKQRMSGPDILWFATGLKFSNPNAWFVIAMQYLYLAFYIAFRFCKKEKISILILCAFTLAYMILGTVINHNDWWMKGEWWYNSIHFFPIGVIFAANEEKITAHIKKGYIFYFLLTLLLILPLYAVSEWTQGVFSYYGEMWHADHVVLRRWVCLISQMLASSAFVFFVFIAGMKIRIGNKFLAFMGSLTLEFYLIHGLYIELFGFDFIDTVKSLYYIKNVALFTLVVFVLGLGSAVLLQKFHNLILHGFKKRNK